MQGDEQAQCALRAQRSIHQIAAAPTGLTQAQGRTKRVMVAGPRLLLTPQVGMWPASKAILLYEQAEVSRMHEARTPGNAVYQVWLRTCDQSATCTCLLTPSR